MRTLKNYLSEKDNSSEMENDLSLDFLTDKELKELEEAAIDPNIQGSLPAVLVMQRKSFRVFPDGQKIAMYYIPRLDKYVTIPYGPKAWATMPKYEETIVDKLKVISEGTPGTIKFANGDTLKVDVRTAKNILEVYKGLNTENQKKVTGLMEQSKIDFNKVASFAWNNIKNS